MPTACGPGSRESEQTARRRDQTCERTLNPMSAAGMNKPGEVAQSEMRVAERREERRMPRRMTRNGQRTD